MSLYLFPSTALLTSNGTFLAICCEKPSHCTEMILVFVRTHREHRYNFHTVASLLRADRSVRQKNVCITYAYCMHNVYITYETVCVPYGYRTDTVWIPYGRRAPPQHWPHSHIRPRLQLSLRSMAAALPHSTALFPRVVTMQQNKCVRHNIFCIEIQYYNNIIKWLIL